MNEAKHRLLRELQGTVLEIGAGYGANFEFYPREIRWIGVEPDSGRHNELSRAAQRYGFLPDIRAGAAEKLEAADASIDAVVSTRVMCSVEDQVRVLAEIRRVLKPGGRYVFVEHVAAPAQSFKRRTQDFLQPLWGRLSGGCHLNRDTEAVIRRAGFTHVEVEVVTTPIDLLAPHIAGVAIK